MRTTDYITPGDAARKYGLAVSTVRSAVAVGRLQSHATAGPTVLLRVRDVEAFIADRPPRGRPAKKRRPAD